jgi:hypothetical protein
LMILDNSQSSIERTEWGDHSYGQTNLWTDLETNSRVWYNLDWYGCVANALYTIIDSFLFIYFILSNSVNVNVYWPWYRPSTFTMEIGCQTLLRHWIWTSFPLVCRGKTRQKGGKGVFGFWLTVERFKQVLSWSCVREWVGGHYSRDFFYFSLMER